MGMGVVCASFRVCKFGESQLPDIARQRRLGDDEAALGECLSELVLVLDSTIADDSKYCGVSLGFHHER
jgi:hypothetical protein